MLWLGRDLQDYLLPTPLPWQGHLPLDLVAPPNAGRKLSFLSQTFPSPSPDPFVVCHDEMDRMIFAIHINLCYWCWEMSVFLQHATSDTYCNLLCRKSAHTAFKPPQPPGWGKGSCGKRKTQILKSQILITIYNYIYIYQCHNHSVLTETLHMIDSVCFFICGVFH